MDFFKKIQKQVVSTIRDKLSCMLRMIRRSYYLSYAHALIYHFKRHFKCVKNTTARMGNPKAALELVIKKLEDVDKAIEFAMEEGDDDLWDALIHLSISNPKFVTGLLNNVGTHIDPTKLIQQIPEHTEIPNLGASLVKLLQDFQVQVNLREGCRKILVKDSHSLMEKLYKLQGSAVYIDGDTICKACGNEVIGTGIYMFATKMTMKTEKADFVLFFCGHVYHGRCVNKKNQRMTCRMCYVHTRAEHRGRKEHLLQKNL
ncbi:Vacuolar protein sorting-associated protein 41 homolog [Geodia barretti]|uniref:Vacuolar protein sorting-associated protein 41 homolog n=1 Tax=Geodia barretti TaxID=519541 RepID=A0AA35RYE3_GEOBA|nr:Vacuolar protein sorting-associated protein 41 homolog [Geodia barretti]